jgi:type II secretory pathway component PulF
MKTWKLEKIISKNAKVVDQPAAVESDSEKELKESVAKEKVEPVKVEKKKEEEKVEESATENSVENNSETEK